MSSQSEVHVPIGTQPKYCRVGVSVRLDLEKLADLVQRIRSGEPVVTGELDTGRPHFKPDELVEINLSGSVPHTGHSADPEQQLAALDDAMREACDWVYRQVDSVIKGDFPECEGRYVVFTVTPDAGIHQVGA